MHLSAVLLLLGNHLYVTTPLNLSVCSVLRGLFHNSYNDDATETTRDVCSIGGVARVSVLSGMCVCAALIVDR